MNNKLLLIVTAIITMATYMQAKDIGGRTWLLHNHKTATTVSCPIKQCALTNIIENNGYWNYGDIYANTIKNSLFQMGTPSGQLYYKINEITVGAPANYSLSQNYPNPFSQSTIIKYSLPQTTFVKLEVLDELDRNVVTLVNENQNAGNYLINLSASNFVAGIYFYKITAGSFTKRIQMQIQ